MELYEDVIGELDPTESWEFLGQHTLGRLAYSLLGEPQIVPINYAALDGRVYFRTAEGTKLFATAVQNKVAFEVDAIEEGTATSVIVHGTVTELDGNAADEVHDQIRPWVDTVKTRVLMIEPTEVTGRHFELTRPATS